MIPTKTPDEIAIMRVGGAKISVILGQLLDKAQPGVALLDIEALADQLIRQSGGEASFRTVKGYKWATCLCVNDVVVHGIPTKYVLKDGDILTIDVGLLYQGFHTDTAWTKLVESEKWKVKSGKQEDRDHLGGGRLQRSGSHDSCEVEAFLRVGQEALSQAIAQARAGNRVGHISQAVQKIVEGAGYGIVKTLVGHGVGQELHEAPQIPGFVKVPVESTPELIPGTTLAIEVIYARGRGAVVYINDDGWSIGTRDGSLASVFEHTIVITTGEPQILTQAP